jgi:hypothetical protein
VLLPVFVTVSLKNSGKFNDFFNPNLKVTTKALIADGFKYSPLEGVYAKVDGDTTFFYNSIAGESSKIYRRSIMIRGATDSLKIAQWVGKNKGFICSATETFKGAKRFFVKGLTSGLISECEVDSRGLEIYLDYPYEIDDLNELQKLRDY